MKRFLQLLIALPVLTSGSLLYAADPWVKEAQAILAALGRYEGAVDGVSTAEFRTALRTFQHDRQLEATGVPDEATSHALKEAAARKDEGQTLVAVPSSPAAAPTPTPPALEPTVVPPSPIPPSAPTVASDRELLETKVDTSSATVRQSEPLLEGTVYAEAEPGVQADVIRRAESILRRHGLLQSDPEASADALLEEAIFRFQSAERLTLTGRLDEPTLAAMRLLPRQERQALPGEWREGETRPVEVFRGRIPRSRSSEGSSNPYPNAVRGIPLD